MSKVNSRQALVATGVDAAERREVHVHIECQAMVGAPVADLDAERGDLRQVGTVWGIGGRSFVVRVVQARRARFPRNAFEAQVNQRYDEHALEMLHGVMNKEAA